MIRAFINAPSTGVYVGAELSWALRAGAKLALPGDEWETLSHISLQYKRRKAEKQNPDAASPSLIFGLLSGQRTNIIQIENLSPLPSNPQPLRHRRSEQSASQSLPAKKGEKPGLKFRSIRFPNPSC